MRHWLAGWLAGGWWWIGTPTSLTTPPHAVLTKATGELDHRKSMLASETQGGVVGGGGGGGHRRLD